MYVHSFYLTDPDGILLEFACWAENFTEADNAAMPKTSSERRPRQQAAH